MNARDYASILSAWTRLPREEISESLAAARKDRLVPALGAVLSPSDAARGLLVTMACAARGRVHDAGFLARLCALELEASAGTDPLEGSAKSAFNRLVGGTASSVSENGYPPLDQSLASALGRHETNLGRIELRRMILRWHGDGVLAILETDGEDGPRTWTFSTRGAVVERTGLQTEVSADRATLSGIAFVLSADAARKT
jgi:hypothetical protein